MTMRRDVPALSPLSRSPDATESSVEPPARRGSGFSAWFAESEPDRAQVAAFVDSIYVKSFGGRPPLADAYVAVEFRGELVSCIGVEREGPDGRLGIERMYRLDRSRLPLTEAVQFVRWASKMPRAGRHALYAAAVFGLARGRSLALVEHNDKVHRHCEKLGLVFRDIPHEGVDFSTLCCGTEAPSV